MEKGNTQENLIKSLINLKHRSQSLMNNKLTFPLPPAEILLLTPIDLRNFHSNYQKILSSVKKIELNNEHLKQEINNFPSIITERYESTISKRVLLIIIALLFFFPLGILIYYMVLTRRGELKLKLTEIVSTCHKIVYLMQHPAEKNKSAQ